MAKKATTKPAAARKSTAVAKTEESTVPSYLTGYTGPTGTEGIENEDITIPRIKIGQSMSEEVKNGDIAEGALFLNVSGDVLCEPGEQLEFVLLARSKEYILWNPREDGGGILARAKPVDTNDGVRYAWDKPNQTFDVKVGGKVKVKWKTKTYIDEDGLAEWGSEIPDDKESGIAATAHHNFVVVIPSKDGLVAALSFSRSSAKKAKDFNALLKLGGRVPVFARKFTIGTVDEKNDKGAFKNFVVKPNGFVDEKSFKVYQTMAEGFTNMNYSVDHSDGDDDAETDARM